MKFLIGRDLAHNWVSSPGAAIQALVEIWLPQLRVYSFRNGFQGLLTVLWSDYSFQDSTLPRQYFWFLNLLFPVAISRIARVNLRLKSWFLVPFFFLLIPVYWVHARTAFEYVLGAGFFWLGVSFAWQYLKESEKKYFRNYAILSWGASQGVYHAFQGGVFCITFIFISFLFFRKNAAKKINLIFNRENFLTGFLLLWIFGPLIYLCFTHWPEFYQDIQIRQGTEQTLTGRIFLNTFELWNPYTWFFQVRSSLLRHHVEGIPQVQYFLLILFSFSLFIKKYRKIIFTLAGITTVGLLSSLLTEVHIFRVLSVIGIWVIGAVLCAEWILSKISKPLTRFLAVLSLMIFSTVSYLNLIQTAMSWSGKQWDDYGLYGVQFGGSVLFQQVHQLHVKYPDLEQWVSADWANAPNWVAEFFVRGEWSQYHYSSLKQWLTFSNDELKNKVFWMMASEYQWVQNAPSSHLKIKEVIRAIFTPDGQPAFYATRLTYAKDL